MNAPTISRCLVLSMHMYSIGKARGENDRHVHSSFYTANADGGKFHHRDSDHLEYLKEPNEDGAVSSGHFIILRGLGIDNGAHRRGGENYLTLQNNSQHVTIDLRCSCTRTPMSACCPHDTHAFSRQKSRKGSWKGWPASTGSSSRRCAAQDEEGLQISPKRPSPMGPPWALL